MNYRLSFVRCFAFIIICQSCFPYSIYEPMFSSVVLEPVYKELAARHLLASSLTQSFGNLVFLINISNQYCYRYVVLDSAPKGLAEHNFLASIFLIPY